MGRSLLLPATALWATTVPVWAAAQQVTLSEAVAEALAASPRIRVVAADVDRAAAQADAARAAFFPVVSSSDSWQRSNQPVFGFSALLAARRFTAADFAVERLNEPGATSAFAGRLFVRQVVFDARTRAEKTSADRQRDLARTTLEAARADLALEVTRVYGRLLTAKAAETAATAAVRAADEDLARAERRRDAGTVTDADVLALSVHAAAMRQRSIGAGGEATVAQAELARLMGRPVTSPLTVADPPPPAAVTAGVDDLLAEAESGRPELRRAEARRDVARAGTRAARAGWFPRLTAQAGYQLEGLTFADRADSWMVGGELTWDVSLGGGDRARTRAAAAVLRAAEANIDETRSAVHLDVLTALQRLEDARARTQAGRAAVDNAAERERITRNRYEAGLASVTDVLSAATARLDAEGERTASLVDTLVAFAMLTRAVGRPITLLRPEV